MPLLDFDTQWDYEHPEQTESLFRQLLAQNERVADASYRLQLLTQIARTQGLQRQFTQAHKTLDTMQEELRPELVTATVRYFLERGRVFNSAGQPQEARSWFQRAWELAREYEEARFFAVDAAHMLAIVAETFEEQVAWNTKALASAEAASEERAHAWCGSLYNNLGWSYHEHREFERALEYFQKALEWQQEYGDPRTIRIARWCIGRVLRSLQRVPEALALQRNLLDDWEKSGEEQDGYVSEEIAECLLLLGQVEESREYFAQAYTLLSRDRWLIAQEEERLQRLQRLSGA